MAGSHKKQRCECMDADCPVGHGGYMACGNPCKNVERTRTLYRVDMEDRTGTAFCAACADDAMASGLFE